MSRLVCIPKAVKALQTWRWASTLDRTHANDPLGSSCEPSITQSMIHYPRSDPRSSGRRVYIDWHNNNSLPDTIWHSPSGRLGETQGKTGGWSQWLIHTVVQSVTGRCSSSDEDEEEFTASKGSILNVTSLIRDARTMLRGQRGRGGLI